VATAVEHPGLSSDEAARRLAARGAGEGQHTSRSLASIVRENVFTLVNAIALGFLVLIVVAGAWADAIFAVIIVVNTAIGITQELLAKRKLDRLALLVAPRARVRRDGAAREVAPEELVEGDVVEIAAGDQVLADGTVVQARGLALDESILTGESDNIAKGPGDTVLSGAFVAAGSGLYEVEAVGDDAFAARLTSEARQAKRVLSPLQLQINSLLRRLLVGMVPLSAALLAALWLHDVEFREGAQTATAGLISIVPEGLVLLASVTLAVAAVRLSKTGAIVQQLNAVESLAGVDTVCLDKTGTLTDGTLELVEIVPHPGVGAAEARSALARLVGGSEARSTTSEAIAEALDTTGAPSGRRELPFSSRWKWSGVEFDDCVLVLGAPEILGAGDLAAEVRRRQAERGRVLVFGRASSLPGLPEGDLTPGLPEAFQPYGIVVLRERLRADAIEVVQFLRDEGVDLKVMSGDAPATVEAVARACGFHDTTTMAGPDVPEDPEELAEAAARTSVFARVTPEQKQALVRALAAKGRYVAMVGDGVNDVPAMKAARISIALGSGSQIAKGVSDIVLVSGDYRAIPRGIAEGRRILSNIRRVAKLFVVKSAFAATLILTVGLAGSAYPLLPRHLSLAALFTVGIPSFALALAPSRGRPPGLDFVQDLLRFSVPGGVVSALAVLAAYGATKSLPDRGLEDARTVAVIVLVLTGLYLILLLEDDAIEQSSQRALGVALLMGTLLLGFVAAFALPSTRDFFELVVPGPIELLLAIMATCFAIGALGLLGFRAPLLARRLFGDTPPPPLITRD
jgi:cation-transporting P-type ATPase E